MSKKSLADQVREQFPEFVDSVASLSSDALNIRLAYFAKDAEAVEDQKDADEELKAAKENCTQLRAPYVEAKKAIRLKSRYIIALLKEQGAA